MAETRVRAQGDGVVKICRRPFDDVGLVRASDFRADRELFDRLGQRFARDRRASDLLRPHLRRVLILELAVDADRARVSGPLLLNKH